MESKFILAQEGQEIEKDDINIISTEAASADDYVFAELFRMLPTDGSTISRGILPYSNGPYEDVPTVQPATGKVKIYPFRAFLGSRQTESESASDNYRGIRSRVFVGTATTQYYTVTFSANNSGNPRWDLVYARIDPDVATSATRYVKSTTDPFIPVPTSIDLYKDTNVVIGKVEGTPGFPATLPSAPPDTSTSYYISLAYVRIGNEYTSSTIINSTDILEVLPHQRISNTSGVNTARPATSQFDVNGPVLSKGTGGVSDWANSTLNRVLEYIPPSTVGEEIIWVAINAQDSDSSHWSQPDGSVVDYSRDWRKRWFYCQAFGSTLSDGGFAWAGPSSFPIPGATDSLHSDCLSTCWGNSFAGDSSIDLVCYFDSGTMAGALTGKLILYVDSSDGTIRFRTDSTVPGGRIFIRICASPQYRNY